MLPPDPDDHSHDRPLVIVSNRLPVRRVRERDGVVWKRSPGGLVSALSSVLRKGRGLWIGWAGHHDATAPEHHDGMDLVSVRLSRQDVGDYYRGFSNATIWPLYHDAIRPAEYRDRWWEAYRRVNQRFAECIARRAAPGARVWVQDYHLQLVPAMLRQLRPDVSIGFFLHVPFPPPELFQQLPWREPLLRGLLAADLVGFHVADYAVNFRRAALQLGGVAARPGGVLNEREQRFVRLDAFPISVDAGAFDRLARSPQVRQSAARLRAKLGAGRRVVLGVDRLDYTKGIEHRLRAYRQLLDDGRLRVGDCVLVQIAVPSREKLRDYAQQRAAVERLVGEVNGRHREPGLDAVHYVYRSFPLDRLVAYYLAADVMAVTPLRDGMNLVAKEFVTCRTDDDGVLVLSEFAGAAHELRQATLVNPHDAGGLADAMAAALAIDPAAGRASMRAMRRTVRENDVYHWADRFLAALEEAHEERPPAAGPRPLPLARPLSAPSAVS